MAAARTITIKFTKEFCRDPGRNAEKWMPDWYPESAFSRLLFRAFVGAVFLLRLADDAGRSAALAGMLTGAAEVA